MQLNNEFTVATGVEETWRLLTDLERVAPCMPGATMNGRDGEDYLGTVKIKVGPIGANFAGKARFLAQDDNAKTATISMAGKDAKGSAAANATIQARLESLGPASTRVVVDTDLDITGRMAQFGRGAIADVSNRLMTQFTENLSREILGVPAGQPSVAPAAQVGAQPSAMPLASAASASASGGDLDLVSLIGPAILQKAGPPLLGFIIGYLVARAFPGRRR